MRILVLSAVSIAALGGFLPTEIRAQNLDLPGGVNIQFGHNRDQSRAEVWVLSKMHQIDQREIHLAQLALDRSHSERVRELARRILDDHQRTDDRVSDVARREDIALVEPQPMNDEQRRIADDEQRTMDDLRDARGDRFDRLYVRAMVEGHEHAIHILEASMDRLHDDDTRRLVDRTMPDLREHLRLARDLQDRMERHDDRDRDDNR